jgi:hypothetical protein
MKYGIIGCGIAFAGSATLASFTPSAIAAGGYNSVSMAQAGPVQVEGQTVAPVKASANDQNLVQDNSISASQIGPALDGIPGIGKGLAASLKSGVPGGASAVVVYAQASSTGQSAACAAVLAASCSNGKLTPLVVKIGLNDLDPTLSSLPIVGSVLSSVTNLVGDDLELSITGPEATCTAGPVGSTSGLRATDQPGTVKADIVDSSGNAVVSPVQLKNGDILSQLGSIGSSLGSAIPLGLTTTPGSTQYGDGTSTASTGGFGLTSQGKNVLDIASATATCGPNTAAGTSTAATAPATPAGGPPAPATSATSPVPGAPSAPTPSATSSEKPLTKIQTDEGRWAPADVSYPKLSGNP